VDVTLLVLCSKRRAPVQEENLNQVLVLSVNAQLQQGQSESEKMAFKTVFHKRSFTVKKVKVMSEKCHLSQKFSLLLSHSSCEKQEWKGEEEI
jgi:hypothetical protein